jgi:hypothetical protein
MKKQGVAFFFYLLYLLAMIRPIIPVLEYYGNYEYIVNVLCENRAIPDTSCQGKCHLKKQIEKYAQPTNPEQNKTEKVPVIDISKYPVSLIPIERKHLQKLAFKTNNVWWVLEGKPKNIQNVVFKPPLFLVI